MLRQHVAQRAREAVRDHEAVAGQRRSPAAAARLQGRRPLSIHAICRPATVPGTPTATWLSWWRCGLVSRRRRGTSWARPPSAPPRGSRRRRPCPPPGAPAGSRRRRCCRPPGARPRARRPSRPPRRPRCRRPSASRVPTCEAIAFCDTTMPSTGAGGNAAGGERAGAPARTSAARTRAGRESASWGLRVSRMRRRPRLSPGPRRFQSTALRAQIRAEAPMLPPCCSRRPSPPPSRPRRPRTLRLDVVHAGNASEERFARDRRRARGRLARQSGAADRRHEPRQVPVRGAGRGHEPAALLARLREHLRRVGDDAGRGEAGLRAPSTSRCASRSPPDRCRWRSASVTPTACSARSGRTRVDPADPAIDRSEPPGARVGGRRERPARGEGGPGAARRRLHRRGDGQVAPRRPTAHGVALLGVAVQGAPVRLQRVGRRHAVRRERRLAPLRPASTVAPRCAPRTTPSAPSATCSPSTTGACARPPRRRPTTCWRSW